MLPFMARWGLKPKPLDNGPRYAGANDRSMASALDIVLLFTLLNDLSARANGFIYAAFQKMPPGSGAPVTSFEALAAGLWEIRYPWLISNGLVVLMIGMLLVACQWAYGTTPGKWLLGLKIVRAGTLEPVAPWRYILRFFAYIPAALPLMLGIFWMSFNRQHRGWHDYIAGTVVIYTRPRGWYWQQIKRGYRWLYSLAVKKPVGEPAAEQGHDNGAKPIE